MDVVPPVLPAPDLVPWFRRKPFTTTLAVLALVLATLVAPFAMSLLFPATPGIWMLDGLALIFVVPFLLLALAGLAAAAVAWRLRSARLPKVAFWVSLGCAAGLLIPVGALWATAQQEGTSLSLSDYWAGGTNYGGAVPERSVIYGTVEGTDLRLDTWLPTGPGPHPAVIMVHGGGFVSGTRSMAPLWDLSLNAQGIAVFDVEYRLAPPERWDSAPQEVACAVAWVRAHAADYAVDPSRIAIMGLSAGGALALDVAYAPQVPAWCTGTDASVLGVVAIYPTTDLVALWTNNANGDARGWMQDFLGGSPTEVPEHYAAASPIHLAHAGAPPTLLIHGGSDHIVRPEESADLARVLKQLGVPHKRVVLPFADHAFDLAWGSFPTQIARHSVARFMDQTLSP